MKTCVVRVFGPAAANATAPRWFCVVIVSSGIVARSHAFDTAGYGLTPNCATNPGTTRKIGAPS